VDPAHWFARPVIVSIWSMKQISQGIPGIDAVCGIHASSTSLPVWPVGMISDLARLTGSATASSGNINTNLSHPAC
jgi:hypothetical protein